MKSLILVLTKTKDYELVDSGGGAKLERFGNFLVSRPDPEAIWHVVNESAWKDADAVYVRKGKNGSWKAKNLPADWKLEMNRLTFVLKPTVFKHVGIFPEQSKQWEWMEDAIKNYKLKIKNNSENAKKIKVLNLFAYTGGASLVCARAGAEVTHVDASKVAVSWAKENAEISGLTGSPLRWIVDDVLSFVRREVRRGNTYDAIVMDPPAFGRGPTGQEWNIEKDFSILVDECLKLLSDKPLFFLVNGYSAGYSAVAYGNVLLPLVEKYDGTVEHGELVIKETSGGRVLPAGIFARWSR